MNIMETVIKISAFSGAIIALWGLIYGVAKWFLKQDGQAKRIEALKNKHNEDISAMKEELCVIDYALLATLDGLRQLNCNGNVTKAHERLEKHLNKQAHGRL